MRRRLDNWSERHRRLLWKNGTNELCWRDGNWTPATGLQGCDGALVAAAARSAAAPRRLRSRPGSRRRSRAGSAAGADQREGDLRRRRVLRLRQGRPEARRPAKLDDLVSKIKGINLEVIIAVGHTDSVGTDAYNQKLSVRRAEAVKAYLCRKGIEKNRVYTEGKGEKQPVADNKTAEGRAKNRRVEIEVVGTRASK